MCVFLVGDGVLLRKASGSRFGKDCWRRWWARLKGEGDGEGEGDGDGEKPGGSRSSLEKPLWYCDNGERDGRGEFRPCWCWCWCWAGCCFWLGWNGEPGVGERLSGCFRGETYPVSGIAASWTCGCGCDARAGAGWEAGPGLSLSMTS